MAIGSLLNCRSRPPTYQPRFLQVDCALVDGWQTMMRLWHLGAGSVMVTAELAMRMTDCLQRFFQDGMFQVNFPSP